MGRDMVDLCWIEQLANLILDIVQSKPLSSLLQLNQKWNASLGKAKQASLSVEMWKPISNDPRKVQLCPSSGPEERLHDM